jgi:hypothetical protein
MNVRAPETLDTANSDRWARVRIVAAAIQPTVNLDGPTAVSRSILAARLCAANFADVLARQ